ncbi:DNA cytosine methyltransferase [Micromonospora sp. DT44]|uniref:DNA cytosine methyltransferase n=1 Tax=Micromonospora sp. DT44 TaxID=3393439 RepID=UPI003CF37642
MNYLSLFSGIGGLDLGLDRAGMTCVGQVEIDPFCRQVLTKNWPEVPKHDDVRTAAGWWLGAARPPVRLVAGGFPCQGHSIAGKQLGTADERWGWPWFRAVVQAVAPEWVLIENVPNLVRTGLRDVLSDLAEDGFDAWWGRVPAAAVGAPHLRWRLFVIAAHPERVQLRNEPGWSRGADRQGPTVTGNDGAAWALADTSGVDGRAWRPWGSPLHGDARDPQPPAGLDGATDRGCPWPAEPAVGRVVDGVPTGVVRPQLRALGNAVVPQAGEYIGRMITAHAVA